MYLIRTAANIQGMAFRWWDGANLRDCSISDVDFAYDTYQSFAWACKAGEQKVYFNGSSTAKATTSYANGITSKATSELVIGATSWYATPRSNYFEGEMGVVLLYDAYKTGAELTAIHNDIRADWPDYSLAEGS